MNLEDQKQIYTDALLARLMTLLSGDRAAVMKRVEQVRKQHPKENIGWQLARTIWEIQQEKVMSEGLAKNNPAKNNLSQNKSAENKSKNNPARNNPSSSLPSAPKSIAASPSTPSTPSELVNLSNLASIPRPKSLLPIQPSPKLIRLLNGDRAASIRLLESVRAANPNRSEQWVQEKVLWDLSRDRGR